MPLLLAPRETLLVLDYLSTHPTATVAAAVRALHISNNTWYLARRSFTHCEHPRGGALPPPP